MTVQDSAAKVTDGDQLDDGYFNDTAGIISIEAGENITAGNVVYIHLTSGTAYVSDTGTANDIRANGIALTSATSGNDVTIQTKGVYTTTGLTDKGDYYLGASGAMSETVSGVRIGTALSTTKLFINIIQDDKDAVGTIKPWLKNHAGMPSNMLTAFWKECDGSVINDSESPLNNAGAGEVPDLNSTQRFLRGAGTSDVGTDDTAGGSDSWSFTYSTIEPNDDNASEAIISTLDGHAASTGGGPYNVSKLPAYIEVVFIMKIK